MPSKKLVFVKLNIKINTYHPTTSSGSSQLPVPSASPILKTVPIGQPYSRACPSKQM